MLVHSTWRMKGPTSCHLQTEGPGRQVAESQRADGIDPSPSLRAWKIGVLRAREDRYCGLSRQAERRFKVSRLDDIHPHGEDNLLS